MPARIYDKQKCSDVYRTGWAETEPRLTMTRFSGKTGVVPAIPLIAQQLYIHNETIRRSSGVCTGAYFVYF